MFKRLLVAYDGSEDSRKALETALELASRFGSQVHLLTVVDDLPRFTTTMHEVEATLERSTRRIEQKHALAHMIARKHGVEIECSIQPGNRVHTILAYAQKNDCDALLIGHKNRPGLWRAFKGSTAIELAYRAPCMTILIQADTDGE